jgi:peptidyl-prolyl cis-trans isomerase C
MNPRHACWAAVAFAFSLSCGGEKKELPPPDEQAVLGGDVAARVASDVIPPSLVAKVAAAQHVTPRIALRSLVDDAIAANAARARGLDNERPTSWHLTAARGRFAADAILADARKSGPPTDDEIAQLTQRYWREVDRPEAIRVIHAIVQRPKKPSADAEDRARALAQQLHDLLVTATDTTDFENKAKDFPHPPDLDVRVEPIPAFTSDGTTTEREGAMDAQFAKGAWAIQAIGETSPIVESSFGWHVIRLVERIPEQRMPLEARRLAFTDEAYLMRARAATRARLDVRKAATKIEVSPSAELLMRSLVESSSRGPQP